MSQFFQRQAENMVYDQNMDMQVANSWRTSSKMQESAMHAMIKLQFNTFEPIHDLTL